MFLSIEWQTTAPHEDGATASQVTTVLWLLIAIAVVAVLTKYIRLPYTIVLVMAGVAFALTPGIPTVVLTPDLIVIAFLPTLLFEAAYNLSFEQLRENIRFISALAIWGVLGTAAVVAGLLIWLGGLPWQTALIFGAIVAATDPISVVATFRRLGAPRRLTILIEGESLFNDGSALVLFNLLVGIIVAEKFSFWGSLAEFVKVAAGGLALGVAIGYLALAVLTRMDDYLTETLVTIIVAYGTFLLAEQLGFSPALAVVAAGLLVGNFGQGRAFSPSSQVAVGLSWELLGFLANSLIFLLVGLEVRAINLSNFWEIALLGIAVTLISRVLVICFFSWLANRISPESYIPFKWQLVLIWGGLRGALSLALALSLPITLASGVLFPDRDKILVMTFGLILFTLLVQGLTVEPLLKFLKLGKVSSEPRRRYEAIRARLITARAARQKLQELAHRRGLNEEVAQTLLNEYNEREKVAEKGLREIQLSHEQLKAEQLKASRRQLLQIEKSTARELFHRGLISQETLNELWEEIDLKLTMLEQSDEEQATNTPTSDLPVKKLTQDIADKTGEPPYPAT